MALTVSSGAHPSTTRVQGVLANGKATCYALTRGKKKNVFLLLALAKQTSQPPNKALLTKSPPLNKISGRKRGAVLTPVLLERLLLQSKRRQPRGPLKKGAAKAPGTAPKIPIYFLAIP